jgi:hypothetical protein
MNWPDDVDGDVLRSLEKDGFNFDKEHMIDFNIDFNQWPPSKEALDIIVKEYPEAKLYDPDPDIEDSCGYVLISIQSKLSYELVMFMQKEITEIMKPYGGWCESWGVMN